MQKYSRKCTSVMVFLVLMAMPMLSYASFEKTMNYSFGQIGSAIGASVDYSFEQIANGKSRIVNTTTVVVARSEATWQSSLSFLRSSVVIPVKTLPAQLAGGIQMLNVTATTIKNTAKTALTEMSQRGGAFLANAPSKVWGNVLALLPTAPSFDVEEQQAPTFDVTPTGVGGSSNVRRNEPAIQKTKITQNSNNEREREYLPA